MFGLNIENVISANAIERSHKIGGFSLNNGQNPNKSNTIEIINPNTLFDPISILAGLRIGSWGVNIQIFFLWRIFYI